MAVKYIAPTVADAFNCPHCGVLAHQTWLCLYARTYDNESLPNIPLRHDFIELLRNDKEIKNDARKMLEEHFIKISKGIIFVENEADSTYNRQVINLHLSKCYSCKQFSVWRYDELIYPAYTYERTPNEDLPDEIKLDFLEASKILAHSPRGSAALLRLCIQKLCLKLGEKGKNINDDIAALVRKGLSERIRKSLDYVRVVGNEAVHPGQIDLRDDRDTASKLFDLINVIADTMISQPKQIDALYESLPEGKKIEIEKRDKRSEPPKLHPLPSESE